MEIPVHNPQVEPDGKPERHLPHWGEKQWQQVEV
jgi:hypothetical protein